VTGADVIRIETDLGLPFGEFICRWADSEGRIARNHAPHFHFDDEPDTPFVICLLHQPSRFLTGSDKCRFLTECEPDADHPLGQARCGIYQSRPVACRVFPTRFNDTGELAVIEDVPQNGRAEGNPAYDLCPRPWEPADLEPIDTVQQLVITRYEMHYFRQLADVWNRSPGPWQDFPEFLHAVYSRRVIAEPASERDGEAPSTLKFLSTDHRDAVRKAA